ncbi:MAG: sigma factor [Clostridia bacterium]|nr:sigma factor [Clostridia bacterium]MDD4047867.1 sigma factor [Clostridia bacterium]
MRKDIAIEDKNELIKKYMPFIISVTAEVTNKYVSVENSEELSISLEAFNEAIDRYESGKGNLLTYAKTVIKSRLIDYHRKRRKVILLDDCNVIEEGYNMEHDIHNKEELQKYEVILQSYGIGFEQLANCSIKHTKTRERITNLVKSISTDQEIEKAIKSTKRLPITLISKKYFISKSVVKAHKLFIKALLVAVYYQISSVLDWLEI